MKNEAPPDHPITRSPDHPMLRIVYLLESTELSGGVKVILLQAEALARRGHHVTLVSPGSAPDWFQRTRARFERSSFRQSAALGEAEVRVATFWTTIAPALEGARGPVFHLCQGYEGDFSFYDAQRAAIEEAYRAPVRRLAVSQTLARRLAERGLGPVADVGQAFDPGEFRPGPERERDGPPVVLLVGPSQADVKGIDVALRGLSLWRGRGASFRVRRIATLPPGEPDTASDLVDEYHHRLAPERMPFAYRAADVFIGPSRAAEGFGLPTLEALSCGVPCLLSDTPGNREIAGAAAWYFRDGDPMSLADALPALLTADARKLARREGPSAAARFETGRVAENLERAFRQALASG